MEKVIRSRATTQAEWEARMDELEAKGILTTRMLEREPWRRERLRAELEEYLPPKPQTSPQNDSAGNSGPQQEMLVQTRWQSWRQGLRYIWLGLRMFCAKAPSHVSTSGTLGRP